jgi:hypothetical protein
MPRRNRRRSFRQRRNFNLNVNAQNQITTFSFTAVYSGSTANSTATVITEQPLIVANLGPRVVAILDNFMYWRMIRLNIKQWVLQNSTLTNDLVVHHGVAFTPMNNSLYTVPTTYGAMSDFPEFREGPGTRVFTINVNRKGLMAVMPSKWLLTTANDNSQSLDCAGTITSAISSTGSDVISVTQYMIKGTIQCCSPTDPANIPLEKKFPRRFGRTSSVISLPIPLQDKAIYQSVKSPLEEKKISGVTIIKTKKVPRPDFKVFEEFEQVDS